MNAAVNTVVNVTVNTALNTAENNDVNTAVLIDKVMLFPVFINEKECSLYLLILRTTEIIFYAIQTC